MFHNCPHFKDLKDNDLVDTNDRARLTVEELDKSVKKLDKKAKNKKAKQKGGKKKPSTTEIRKHIDKIIKYHIQKVNESIPSIYPVLGPANSDDEHSSDGDFEQEKRMHTKKEMMRGTQCV